MQQLNEQDIKERLGQLMLTMWQLDKELARVKGLLARLDKPAAPTGETDGSS